MSYWALEISSYLLWVCRKQGKKKQVTFTVKADWLTVFLLSCDKTKYLIWVSVAHRTTTNDCRGAMVGRLTADCRLGSTSSLRKTFFRVPTGQRSFKLNSISKWLLSLYIYILCITYTDIRLINLYVLVEDNGDV